MIALYPGSFDPVTLGHVDMVRRVAGLAEQVIVAVLDNPHKTPLFSAGERMGLLRGALGDIPGVEVAAFSGLLAAYARQRQVTAIIRGVRDGEDWAGEARYAWHNRLLDGGVETLLLPASPAFSHISSRIVREAAAHIYRLGLADGPLRQLVPPEVCAALMEKYITKG
ncbi:MAG: pantetheine-phosphate adenylyltransferase [Defluviitaleaceae bacterium]|nr:pantetheine-phosphate adenylyltransferase [Defluviitaleaceae bacterium]MCL2238707.1 pantetheine-phosphate adenylyltransferase [Defluviitaleaceae bacterium]